MPPAFAWRSARVLEEALGILAEEPDVTPIAGGTDLMVLVGLGDVQQATFLDIRGLGELRGVTVGGDETVVGALTTYSEIAASPRVRAHYPLLVEAARVSGAWAIQNRGTLGGNIANASPAADSSPALLVYAARVELASRRGTRWVPYAEFHLGYRRTVRASDELITRIALPPPQGRGFYRKVGTRRAQAISKVGFAGLARWRDDALEDVRIALASVAPTVLEARRTAAWLRGRRRHAIDLAEARAILEAEVAPIDDLRSTARYRRTVAGNLLEQFLEETAPR